MVEVLAMLFSSLKVHAKKKRLEVQSKKKGPDEKKTSTQIPGCIKV